MLKDRRALMDQEIIKLKKLCGLLYFKMVTGDATYADKLDYDYMKAELSDKMSDLLIIDQMIADGHQ